MRIFLFIVTLVVGVSILAAQPRASVSYATFKLEDQPYVEVYVTVERNSLKAREEAPLGAEFTLVFTRDEQIVAADKVNLLAPEGDSLQNFVEALRYTLPNGEYDLSVTGVDLADPDNELKLRSTVSVDYPSTGAALSDIQLASLTREVDATLAESSLVKGDLLLEPLPQNFVRRGQTAFTAYIEAYTPPELLNEDFVLEYTMMQLPDGGDKPVELSRKTKRFKPTLEVMPFHIQMSTSSLGSGNYALRMVLRDRTLSEISKRITLVTISNPGQDIVALGKTTQGYEDSWVHQMSEDSLKYTLQAVLPTLPGPEVEYINEVVRSGKPAAMRLAVYNHFLGESSLLPEVAYNAYMKVAREVDFHFQSGFGPGFQTDRGHIYLKYGIPDDRVVVNDDPSAPPYEIWVYNFVERTGQSPGKFLFYNQTLDNASYTLLHSTVRGELNEPQWRRYLYSRSGEEFEDPDSVQGTDVADNVGRYADQYFADF